MMERLKHVRKALKMNQTDFAARLGMTQGGYARIELGKRQLTDRTILQICKEYHVSEEWLRTGNGDMFLETKCDFLNKLSKTMHLTPDMKDTLDQFLTLPDDDRKSILHAVQALVGEARETIDEARQRERAEAHRKLDEALDAREKQNQSLKTEYIVDLSPEKKDA